jgi:hypothetical protein
VKNDKSEKYESLSLMRSGFKVNKTIADQWILVNIMMYSARDTTAECWTNSFDACNMDPNTRVSFSDWCIRISQFLQAGESFKHDTFDVVPSENDIYSRLPPMWHAMPPWEKKVVMTVAEKHNK